jgi:monomeric isocitrate dehydrogenase
MKGDLENLEKLLLIDKNTTSAAIRRRTSAHDNRNSSIAMVCSDEGVDCLVGESDVVCSKEEL